MNAASTTPLALQLLLLAIVAVALLLLMRVSRRAVQLLPLADQQRRWLVRLGPALAGIVVAAFLVFAARLQLSGPPRPETWALLAVLLVILAAGWLALRDAIAGVLVKAGGICQTGKRIRLEELEGKITSLGVRTLTLETANGEVAVLPYRKLLQQTLYIVPEAQGLVVHRFELCVPPEMPMSKLRAWLTEAALSMHYCSVARTPELVYLRPGCYEVTVFALHPDYTSVVEFRLRKSLSERMPGAKVPA